MVVILRLKGRIASPEELQSVLLSTAARMSRKGCRVHRFHPHCSHPIDMLPKTP